MKNPSGRLPPNKNSGRLPQEDPPRLSQDTPPGSLHSSSSGKRTQGLEAFVLNETVNFPMDLETICLWPGKSQVNMSRVKWEAQSSDRPETASNEAGFAHVKEWTLERLKPPLSGHFALCISYPAPQRAQNKAVRACSSHFTFQMLPISTG